MLLLTMRRRSGAGSWPDLTATEHDTMDDVASAGVAEIATRWEVSADVAEAYLLPLYAELAARNQARVSRVAQILDLDYSEASAVVDRLVES